MDSPRQRDVAEECPGHGGDVEPGIQGTTRGSSPTFFVNSTAIGGYMATTCPIGFDVEDFRSAVHATYDRVARDPDSPLHFNTGLDYAVNLLRYERSELDTLPARATARFAGVGNPHRVGLIHEGETVVDIGSGGGTDLLIAAQRVGES